MSRDVRYQGAIIRDDCILLIKHKRHATGREYWVIPGGGREDGETELECVRREVLEETHLQVIVESLLLDEPAPRGGAYQRFKTYACIPVAGEASPGEEPESDAASRYAITEVKWFDLRDTAGWDAALSSNPIAYPMFQRIRAALGYEPDRQGA